MSFIGMSRPPESAPAIVSRQSAEDLNAAVRPCAYTVSSAACIIARAYATL